MDTLLAWLTAAADFFGAERYSQHAICLTNDFTMIFLYTVSESATGTAYLVMGAALVGRRLHIRAMSSAAIALYGSFIFLCGLQHYTSTLVIYTGVYRLDILVKCLMAGVSVVTAFFTVQEVLARGQVGEGS